MADRGTFTETLTSSEGEKQSGFALPERWRLERILGVGGQGQVWLAFDSELEELVAVKVLARPDRPTAVERLKREVRVGRKLRHENLVQIYELVDAGPSIAVVMEYLDGGNLSQRLGNGPVSVSEVERIADALLQSLECLHREGIVHRDVKPSNVLFDSRDVVKLADFGTLSPISESGDLTATNLTVGTPAYMSPEQVRGAEPAPASDLYSLGVTLYHLVAGKRPFEGGSEFDVARMQVTDEATPVRRIRSDCPRWLARYIHRLMEKAPENRWKDGGEALSAFRAKLWRPNRRGILRGMLAAGVLVAIGFLGVVGVGRLSDVHASVENGALVARNVFGRTLWKNAVEGIRPFAVSMKSAAAGGHVILTAVSQGKPGLKQLELRLFGRDGSPLEDLRVTTDYSGVKQFPGMSENLEITSLEVFDLGGEIGESAVWIATDISWYPGAIGIWPGSDEVAPKVLMVNSGHFREVEAFDFNGDGHQELMVAGVNNELGFQAFAAVIDPAMAPSKSPELASPEQISSVGAGLLGYVLLGEENEPDIQIEPAEREGDPPVIRLAHRTVEMTPDGAVEGLSLQQTKSYWIDVVHTATRLQNQGGRWNSEVEEMGRRHLEVWSRLPYRAGAAFIMAKALAEAGRPEVGALVLEDAKSAGVRMRRLDRRIGEMRLLAGDRPAGRAALWEAIDSIGQGFGPVDELLDLGLHDALTQDAGAWRDTSNLLGSFQFNHYRQQLEVVFNFFGGRFSSCGLDLKMGPGVLHSAFVLRYWAAIEEGGADEKTVEHLRALELLAECRSLATLALARSEILAGRPGAATARAGEAVWRIRNRALASWPDAVYLPLIEWAYGTILQETGSRAEARTFFLRASTSAPNTFFGRDAAARLER